MKTSPSARIRFWVTSVLAAAWIWSVSTATLAHAFPSFQPSNMILFQPSIAMMAANAANPYYFPSVLPQPKAENERATLWKRLSDDGTRPPSYVALLKHMEYTLLEQPDCTKSPCVDVVARLFGHRRELEHARYVSRYVPVGHEMYAAHLLDQFDDAIKKTRNTRPQKIKLVLKSSE